MKIWTLISLHGLAGLYYIVNTKLYYKT